MFIALDKLENQGLNQAIIAVPERSIGASFNDEPLSKLGFWADWKVEPKWNLCNAPGGDSGKVDAVGRFLESDDRKSAQPRVASGTSAGCVSDARGRAKTDVTWTILLPPMNHVANMNGIDHRNVRYPWLTSHPTKTVR
jgi:hypothetical protein